MAERARFCYLCRSTCTADDHCAGCGKTICDRCDKAQPIGKHEPEAHRRSRSDAATVFSGSTNSPQVKP